MGGKNNEKIFSWETLLTVERFPIDCRKSKEGKVFNTTNQNKDENHKESMSTQSQIYTDVTLSSEECIWRQNWFYIVSDCLREWCEVSKPIHRT